MKRKIFSILFALALVVSFSLIPATPVSAAAPIAPTIDGVISTGEWAGATVIPVASAMGNVSVIAEPPYLYVLFNVTDSTDARLGENSVGNDKIGLNINPTAGVGTWGKPYDIVFQTGADPAAFQTVPPGGVSSGMSDGWYTEWVIDGTQLMSLPGDLETKTIYNYGTGTRISEWKVPLATIAPSPGDTLKLGGACDNLHVVGGAQGNSYSFPPTLDWNDPASTFVDILVGGRLYSKLVLENKDASWNIILDPTGGILDYNASGPTFDYQFQATGLTPSIDYSLIYYADQPDRYVNWGGDNPGALIATFTTDGSGNIAATTGSKDLDMNLPCPPDANMDINNHDYSGSPDFYLHATGAKIWLVPTSALPTPYPDDGGWAFWGPLGILFETDLIWYNDTDVASPVVGLGVFMAPMVAISVTPGFINFGPITLPYNSGNRPLTIKNTGQVWVDITTELSPTPTVFDDHLWLPYDTKYAKDFTLYNLVGGTSYSVNARLVIPRDYRATGLEKATLIFWAQASP